jgi:ABC-2 type transport system permease protein
MQLLSQISPLNWGLNGFNDLFVRDSGLMEVLSDILSLLLFFLFTLFISYWMNRRRRRM